MTPEQWARLEELTPGRPGRDTWIHLLFLFREVPLDDPDRARALEFAAERTRTWPNWAGYDLVDVGDFESEFPWVLVKFHSNEVQEPFRRGEPWLSRPWPAGARFTGLYLQYPSAEVLAASRVFREKDLSHVVTLRMTRSSSMAPWADLEATATEDGQGPLDFLFDGVPLEGLRELDLRRAGISPSEVSILGREIALPRLETLVLSENLVGLRGAEELATSPLMDSLHRLYLRHSDLGVEAAEVLAQAPARRLHHLDLSDNGLDDGAAEALARGSGLPALRSLNLGRNRVGPRGAAILAEAARHRGWLVLNLHLNRVHREDLPRTRGLMVPRRHQSAPPESPPPEAGRALALLEELFPEVHPGFRRSWAEEADFEPLRRHLDTLTAETRQRVEVALVDRCRALMPGVFWVTPAPLFGDCGIPPGSSWRVLGLFSGTVARRCLEGSDPASALLLRWSFSLDPGDEALELAAQAVGSGSDVRALRSVLALGEVPGLRAVPYLLRTLEDPRELVRAAACAALSRVVRRHHGEEGSLWRDLRDISWLEPPDLPGPAAGPEEWRRHLEGRP